MNHLYSLVDALRSWTRIIIFLAVGSLGSEAFCRNQPSQEELLIGVAGVGLAVGIELYAKDHLLPSEPRFSIPNRLDAAFRKKMYWGPTRQEQARLYSDGLIYGVSLSSMVWGPLAAKDPKLATLINLEVFAVNSMVTNLIKIVTARERPYHYYGTAPDRGPIDYASFISGHSSVAFSQAVANAMILSETYPDQSTLIWSTLLTTAGVTAYFRVAADVHYFSDIVVGAGIGSLIAWGISRYELDRFQEKPSSGTLFRLSFKMSLG